LARSVGASVIAIAGMIRWLALGVVLAAVVSNASAAPPMPVNQRPTDIDVARAWLYALANNDTAVLAKTTHLPLRSVNPQNSPGRAMTVRAVDPITYSSVAHAFLVVALQGVDATLTCTTKTCAQRNLEIHADMLDRKQEQLPEDLRKYSREIDKLVASHASLVRVTVKDGHDFTNYVLLAIKQGKVYAAFGTGIASSSP
jgi:hypothetical protein